MPSYEPFKAIRAVDLRHELASRGLPTEGLKKDLAFRLAMYENPPHFCPLPHPDIALPSVTSSKEVKGVKMEGSDIPTTAVKQRGPKRSSPSNKDRSIRSLAQISTTFNNALLSILLVIFLSCISWHYLPTVNKEYLTMRIDNGHDFLSSKINGCQDFITSKINNGYHSICRGVQPVDGIHEADSLPEDSTWLHFPDHYKVLDVPKDASDSTIMGAYNLKVSRWQNENAADLSLNEEILMKIFRQSRDVLLNPEERERFDSLGKVD